MAASKFTGIDYPKYFRITKQNKTQIFYEYNSDLNNFTEALSLTSDEEKEFKLKKENYIFNNTINFIYGFLSKLPPMFYVVNNIGYKEHANITGKLSDKNVRKGAKCGHGINVTSVSDISQTINTILTYKIYTSSRPKTRMKQTSVYKGKSLCQELEFLLRFRQKIRNSDDISRNIMWFYKIEEIF